MGVGRDQDFSIVDSNLVLSVNNGGCVCDVKKGEKITKKDNINYKVSL